MDETPSQIQVKVTPNAKKNEIVGWRNKILLIKVTAPPEDGKANKSVIELLRKHCKVSKASFKIIKGEKSRHKTIECRKQILIQNMFNI
jgi:uncharacterized protein